MTTSPPGPVRWDPPLPGGWLRHFRWGEWLPEPVTPLFDSWFLARSEARFIVEQAAACGVRSPPPLHVLVNGWYYHSPVGSGRATVMLRGLFTHPRFTVAFIRHNQRPEVTERLCAAPHLRRWQRDLLPRYQQLVAQGSDLVSRGSPTERFGWIDQVADFSGALMWSVSMVGGFAWKAESSLARFFGQHLRPRIGGSHQTLLAGLTRPAPPPPHAVSSLDWYHPTTGEQPRPTPPPDPARHDRLERARREAETACRRALADNPRWLARFQTRLEIAHRWAIIREDQLSQLTLAWPLLRRALLSLGTTAVAAGALADPADVFFLTRDELQPLLGPSQTAAAGITSTPAERSSLTAAVAERRAAWERNRRLTPPLVVGKLPGFLRSMITSTVTAMRVPPRAPVASAAATLEGMPASPGRATGVARILLDPSDEHRLAAGEILVARATTPAWTPLFARAGAVVTDAGSVVAHASLIAREYGIPAVVATGDATRRLQDGQRITVDGNTGHVELDAPA